MEEESLIEEFFGKKDGITKEELEDFLREVDESITLEFKEIRDPKQAKRLILKSLVGFLNSVEGKGLLIVGVSDDKQIKGISASHLSRQRIMNWIKDGIGSVPPAIVNPYAYVTEVDVENNKYVYLIEVKRKDDVVYFSRESGCAYIRVGDSTKRLDLSESLELVAKKSLAKPRLEFEVYEGKFSPDLVSIKLDPILKNDGSKPAFYLTVTIEFHNLNIIESKVESSISPPNIRKINDYMFLINVGFPPSTVPIYPTKLGFKPNGTIVLKFYPPIGSPPR